MRWQAKAALQAALSRFPGGYSLYRRLQRAAGTDRLDLEDEYARKSRFLQRFHALGLEVKDRAFLEVGTGWHPFLPLLLRLMGARSTVTVDVNPWMTPATLVETLSGVQSLVPRLASDFAIDEQAAREALAVLARRARNGEGPREVLRAAAV